MAPITSDIIDQKRNHYEGAMGEWHSFVDDTKSSYGVDMSILTDPFREEQRKYYLQVCSRIVLKGLIFTFFTIQLSIIGIFNGI